MLRTIWKPAAILLSVLVAAVAGGVVANAQGQASGPTWQPAPLGLAPAKPTAASFEQDSTYAWFTDGKRVIVCAKRADVRQIACSEPKALP